MTRMAKRYNGGNRKRSSSAANNNNSDFRPEKRAKSDEWGGRPGDNSHKKDGDTVYKMEDQAKPRDTDLGHKSRSPCTTAPAPRTPQARDENTDLAQHGPGISDMPDYSTALASGCFLSRR